LKTIVYQSFRTHDVPSWIDACMRSVRDWAAGKGFAYRFYDDRLFDRLPAWYRAIGFANLLPHTNLARLLVARELLADGFERTLWVDADVLVFDPEPFHITIDRDFAFSREVRFKNSNGEIAPRARVNNSLTLFVRGNSFLDYCIWAHEELARRGLVTQHGTTTRFLSALDKAIPLPIVEGAGLLSPPVMHDLLHGNGALARRYAIAHGPPLRAVNLGASLCGVEHDGLLHHAADYSATVELLLAERGASLGELGAAPRAS
jgi:hypothetical protein